MTEATILSEVRGALGVLTLNRPKAINALDVSMDVLVLPHDQVLRSR